MRNGEEAGHLPTPTATPTG
jgi:voltage-gated potassium channel